MSDRIPQPLFDAAGNVQTDLARRRCGTLARAVAVGVAAADHVRTAFHEDGIPDLTVAQSAALDSLFSWARAERERWHL